MAELPPVEVLHLLGDRTSTIEADSRAPQPVAAHLEQLRATGYAVNGGYTTDEKYGVSAPVRDYRGIVVGCITVSAPRSRVYKQNSFESLAEAATGTAGQVSERFGATPATKATDVRA